MADGEAGGQAELLEPADVALEEVAIATELRRQVARPDTGPRGDHAQGGGGPGAARAGVHPREPAGDLPPVHGQQGGLGREADPRIRASRPQGDPIEPPPGDLGQIGQQGGRVRVSRAAGVLVRDVGRLKGLDRLDSHQPDRGPMGPARDGRRSAPSAKGQRDGPGRDPLECRCPKEH